MAYDEKRYIEASNNLRESISALRDMEISRDDVEDMVEQALNDCDED